MIYEGDVCSLCGDHQVEAFSDGPFDAEVVVVTNRKNSGKYQQALDLQLLELGIDPGKVYFTPVIKCRDFEVTLTSKQLKNHASHWVIPELDSLPNVKYILALGNEALTATIGKSGITKYRGRTFTRGDAEVIATISPSAVNRN